MEKGKAEVQNLNIAFPCYTYTFFTYSFKTQMANYMIYTFHLAYSKYIWNIIFHTHTEYF